MAITAWSENIHEMQEGEVLREWCYLEPFLWFNGSLRDYAKLLDYAFQKQCTDKVPVMNRHNDEFLQDHKIQFHKDDTKKGKPPGEDQLQNWSKGKNCKADVKYTWAERRDSFRRALSEDARLMASAEFVAFIPTMIEGIKSGFIDAVSVAKNEKMNGKYSSNKAESNAKAKNTEINSFRTLAGYDDMAKGVKVEGAIETVSEIKQETNFDYTDPDFMDAGIERMRKLIEDSNGK